MAVPVTAFLFSTAALCVPGYGAVREERRMESEDYPTGEKKRIRFFLNEQLEKVRGFFPRAGVAHDRLKKEESYAAGQLLNTKEYYESGQLRSESVYEPGGRRVFKEYGVNKKLKGEVVYQNGKLDGPVKCYYEQGQLRSEMFYKDGKLEGVTKEYEKSGSLKK